MELEPKYEEGYASPDTGISAELALQQIANLCRRLDVFDVEMRGDRKSFITVEKTGDKKAGILSISGEIADNAVITVKTEIIRASENTRIATGVLFKHMASIGEKCRVAGPQKKDQSNEVSCFLELQVKAEPLSATRTNALLNELKKIDELAKALQKEIPSPRTHSELDRLFEKDSQVLEPIFPWNFDLGPRINQWAEETCDFLSGSLCIAVSSPWGICVEFALSALSKAGERSGRAFGRCLPPAINAKAIVEIAGKAPGTLVIPASRISLGTSPYEMGNEMQAMLSALSSENAPAVFTGTYEQLQGVFHGGQGGQCDPLSPVVRRIPDVPIEDLARFAIWSRSNVNGGIPQSAQTNLTRTVIEVLRDRDSANQRRLLTAVASRVVSEWSAGKSFSAESTEPFMGSVSRLSESLAGLSAKPRVSRSPHVQEHFTAVLTNSNLIGLLEENLLGQQAALNELVGRLRMEILTRPMNQPIRYCAQGTPATGKSESAVLIARSLTIPYVNIDAASMPDYHTAAAQLLGSGRGIVGSHQSGRLEQAAKHHEGALIEVSDLDHAVPAVRSAMADLFLQVLETGEAQSATGAMFSCSNIIFAFTMNLPDGMDEAVYRSIGFGARSKGEISARVSTEIKRVLSSAFLSRVGTPILFEPLNGEALTAIVERAIMAAILSATSHLHLDVKDIALEPGIGKFLFESMEKGAGAFGARGLLERGRVAVSNALIALLNRNVDLSGKSLRIQTGLRGSIEISFC